MLEIFFGEFHFGQILFDYNGHSYTHVLWAILDVLALEFVESIDDILYNLFKRGFFGQQLRVATNNTYYIHC